MGTSGLSRGPGSGTSLVPTWLEEPTSSPFGNGDGTTNEVGQDSAGNEDSAQPTERPAILPPPVSSRFQGARTNFTRFARSGGSNTRALRRAVHGYVSTGTRGSRNASSRMGSARITASGALGLFRGFLRDGVENTLRQLNLGNLVGRSAEDLLTGLTDTICRDGGSIDEAIARDAWLETIAELDQFGIEDFDALTTDQVREVFLAYVANAIETRLFQDIGTKGFRVAASMAEIQSFEAQLKSYIHRGVRDSFSSDLSKLTELGDKEINSMVDRTYREAWELLEAWGGVES